MPTGSSPGALDRRLDVPGDQSIIEFDDSPAAPNSRPPYRGAVAAGEQFAEMLRQCPDRRGRRRTGRAHDPASCVDHRLASAIAMLRELSASVVRGYPGNAGTGWNRLEPAGTVLPGR